MRKNVTRGAKKNTNRSRDSVWRRNVRESSFVRRLRLNHA